MWLFHIPHDSTDGTCSSEQMYEWAEVHEKEESLTEKEMCEQSCRRPCVHPVTLERGDHI